jgi:hypothetical protein
MHGMTTPHCGYCGRPVIGPAIYAGGLAYHNECTRGPGAQQAYQAQPLTAEMVRQIVREELARMTPNAPHEGPARASCAGPLDAVVGALVPTEK